MEKGWNAIYVSPSSPLPADELFGQWPVQSVSVYRPSEISRTDQVRSGLSDEAVAPLPLGIWTREEPAASTLRLLAGDSVIVCFNTNSAPFHGSIEGVPSAPRIFWESSVPTGKKVYHYVGVRLTGPVAPEEYFAGANLGSPVFMKFGGIVEDKPLALNPRRGTTPWTLDDGDALLVSGDRLSDWSGPLHVSPRTGIHFSDGQKSAVVEIRNDGATSKNVSLSLRQSEDRLSLPTLMWRDSSSLFYTNQWEKLSEEVSKTIPTGGTWRVALAVDWAQFSEEDSGKVFGGILHIEEQGGTRMLVDLPAKVLVEKGVASRAIALGTWSVPAGLWEGEAEFSTVTRLQDSGISTNQDDICGNDLPAGGKMNLRFLLHVSSTGKFHLLQRVLVAQAPGTNGFVKQALYLPSETIDKSYDSVFRISCCALPAGLCIPPSTVSNPDGKSMELGFDYTIGADNPSNPFYHALHPLFDGLQMDFKTPAPSGDLFENYVGDVKPERFSVKGNITLNLDPIDEKTWSSHETERRTGRILWSYTGLRKEGPIRAGGTFVLTRVVPIGVLNGI